MEVEGAVKILVCLIFRRIPNKMALRATESCLFSDVQGPRKQRIPEALLVGCSPFEEVLLKPEAHLSLQEIGCIASCMAISPYHNANPA